MCLVHLKRTPAHSTVDEINYFIFHCCYVLVNQSINQYLFVSLMTETVLLGFVLLMLVVFIIRCLGFFLCWAILLNLPDVIDYRRGGRAAGKGRCQGQCSSTCCRCSCQAGLSLDGCFELQSNEFCGEL